MRAARPSLPSLHGDKPCTDGTVICHQSVGFDRNTGGTARFYPVLLFAQGVFYLKIITEKEHKDERNA